MIGRYAHFAFVLARAWQTTVAYPYIHISVPQNGRVDQLLTVAKRDTGTAQWRHLNINRLTWSCQIYLVFRYIGITSEHAHNRTDVYTPVPIRSHTHTPTQIIYKYYMHVCMSVGSGDGGGGWRQVAVVDWRKRKEIGDFLWWRIGM